jgi:acyl-coenzyme A synthetase/AMP-(fatty) acid ligase
MPVSAQGPAGGKHHDSAKARHPLRICRKHLKLDSILIDRPSMDSAVQWISTPHLRPDHRGPVDRPFRPFADPACALPMLETLAAVARAAPDTIAIVDAEGELSRAAMHAAIASLAAAITAADRHGPVGILLGKNRHYIIAIYACLAARRVSVLLDASFPDSRSAAIAAATGADLVLTTADKARGLDWPGVTALAVDIARPAAPLPGEQLALDAPFIILCTSGSSGQPKPIVHSQRTLLHWARYGHNASHVTPSDCCLSLSSPASLGGVTPMLSYTLAGAGLVLLDIASAGLAGLIETLMTQPVTILRAAPSLLRTLVRLPDATAIFARLRNVQAYGEPLLKADVEALRVALPAACQIRSTYGSTEASGLGWFAGSDDSHDAARVPAGILMPDTEAAIIAEDGSNCPRGVPGELIIRSRYNALGEWRDGAVVAGSLLADAVDPALRIFATGDIARCSEDGVFVVLGRKDRMLNINGQRVEPAEIERVLSQAPGVNRVEIIVAKRGASNAMIAFIIAAPDAPDDLPARCRAHVRAALPAYMIPARILTIDAIPMLPSGKTDLQTLLRIADET